MALRDDANFYLRVTAAWLLSAIPVLEILGDFIAGLGFRAKRLRLGALLSASLVSQDALRLLIESRRSRVPAVPGLVERVLMDDAGGVWALLCAAAGCAFTVGLVVGVAAGEAIRVRRMPPRPRPRAPRSRRREVGPWAAAYVILMETLVFLYCASACFYRLPALVRDYMAATANGGDAAAA
ncbi:hypothetical protein ACP70R_046264 [Stipagrostis hirtigluma subsp. patula]